MFRYDPQQDFLHFMALCHIPGLGSRRLQKLCSHFTNMAHLLSSDPTTLRALGLTPAQTTQVKTLDLKLAEQAQHWQQQADTHHIMTWFDQDYPLSLQEIPAKPPLLFLNGQRALLQTPKIAIVGSRHPSASGLHTAQLLSQALSQQSLLITSGLALGIDGAAHKAALQAQAPTIAVLGTGLKHIYPKRHQQLAQQIITQGLLVSEFPLDTLAKPQNFPQRNRLISGLSLGVIVIEAALKSGSLITARYALEQNREVFAVPGSIHHALARGPHALIKQGAKLVESVNDILEELPQVTQATPTTPVHTNTDMKNEQKLNKNAKHILQLIAHTPISVDHLLQQIELPIAQVNATLSDLQMRGLIQTNACGQLERVYEQRCA